MNYKKLSDCSESVSKRFKTVRQTLNMNQKEFGDALGISKDVVSNIESNRTEIKDSVIKLLCRTFNVDYMWLTTGKEEMFFVNDESEDYSLQFNDICKEVFDDFGSYSSLRARELTKKYYNIEFSNNAKLVEEGMRLGETMLIEAVKDFKEGKSSEEVYKKYGHRIAEEAAMLCDNVGI